MTLKFCASCAEVILAAWRGRPLHDSVPILPAHGSARCPHGFSSHPLDSRRVRWERPEGESPRSSWRLKLVERVGVLEFPDCDGLPYHSTAPCRVCRRRVTLSWLFDPDGSVGEKMLFATNCSSCGTRRLHEVKCRSCRSRVVLERQVIRGREEGVYVCLDEHQILCGARSVPREVTESEGQASFPFLVFREIPSSAHREPMVVNCVPRFARACPQRWDRLEPTDSALIRFCEHCEEDVHFCGSKEDARLHAELGHTFAMRFAVGDGRFLSSFGAGGSEPDVM